MKSRRILKILSCRGWQDLRVYVQLRQVIIWIGTISAVLHSLNNTKYRAKKNPNITENKPFVYFRITNFAFKYDYGIFQILCNCGSVSRWCCVAKALCSCSCCRNLAVCQTRGNSVVGSCFTVVFFAQGTRTDWIQWIQLIKKKKIKDCGEYVHRDRRWVFFCLFF